jgi:glycerol-3-phosphate O-acyltransferase
MIDLAPSSSAALHARLRRRAPLRPGQLEEIAALGQRHPVVFLPTHKSNLDHPVLQYMLYENGTSAEPHRRRHQHELLPDRPLVRRSGVFFIRRTFKDNEVYKFVLRSTSTT